MSDPSLRTFSTFLAAVEDGKLHADLTDVLRDIVAGLNDLRAEHGGGKYTGGMKLDITFTLDNGVMEVNTKIDTKMPKPARPKAIMWVTPENMLSASNPKQPSLFRDATAPQEARSV